MRLFLFTLILFPFTGLKAQCDSITVTETTHDIFPYFRVNHLDTFHITCSRNNISPFRIMYQLNLIDTFPTFEPFQLLNTADTCFEKISSLKCDSIFRIVSMGFNFRGQITVDSSDRNTRTILYYYGCSFRDENPAMLLYTCRDTADRISLLYANEYYSFNPDNTVKSISFMGHTIEEPGYNPEHRLTKCILDDWTYYFSYDKKGNLIQIKKYELPEWMEKGRDYWRIYKLSN